MGIKQWWFDLIKPDMEVEEFKGHRQFHLGCQYLLSGYYRMVDTGFAKRNFVTVDWPFKEGPKFFQISIRLIGREMVEGDL
jgi:hypothetical protein